MTMTKTKFLKSLLTTASTLAVLTAGVQSAEAGIKTTNANNSRSNVGGDWFEGAALADGDWILLAANTHSIELKDAGRIIASINLNNLDARAQTLKITESASVGSVSLKGGGGGTIGMGMKLDVQNAKTLTLSGTVGGAVGQDDYSGLGASVLTGDGTFKVSTGRVVDFAAATTITGNGANEGVLIIDAVSDATFNGAIGGAAGGLGNTLRNIQVGSAAKGTTVGTAGKATFKAAVSATTIDIGGKAIAGYAGGNGVATFEGQTYSSRAFTIGGDSNAASAGGTGEVNLVSAGMGPTLGGFLKVAADGLHVGGKGGVGAGGGVGAAGGNGKLTSNNNSNILVTLGGFNFGGVGGAGNGANAGGNGGAVVASVLDGEVTVSAGGLNIGGTGGAGDAGGAGVGGDGGALAANALKFTGKVTVTADGLNIGGKGGEGDAGVGGNGGEVAAGALKFEDEVTVNAGGLNIGGKGGAGSANANNVVGGVGGAAEATFVTLKANEIKIGGAGGAGGAAAGAGGGDGGVGKAYFKGKVTDAVGNAAVAIAVGGAAGAAGGGVGAAGGNGAVGEAYFSGAFTSLADITFGKANSKVQIGDGNAAATTVQGDINFDSKAATVHLYGGVAPAGLATANGAMTNGNSAAFLETSGHTRVTGAIGNVSALASLTIGKAADAVSTFDRAVTSNTIQVGNGAFNGEATFAGAITAAGGITIGDTGGGAGNGTVKITGVGATGAPVTFGTNGSSLSYESTGNLTGAIGFAGKNATLTVKNIGIIIGAITTATTSNTGHIVFDNGANNTGITGAIGTNAMRLNTITTQGNTGAVALGDREVYVQTLNVNSGSGVVTLVGALTVGTGQNQGVIFGNGNAVLALATAAAAGGGGMVGNVDFAGNDAKLTAAAGATITGNIDNTVGTTPKGNVEYAAGGVITGTIGANNSINALQVGDGALGLTHATQNTIFKAAEFRLSHANSVLQVTAPGAELIGDIKNTTTTADKGTLTFAAGGKIDGAIGGIGGASLAAVNVGNGSLEIKKAGPHYAQAFNLDQPNSGLVLNTEGLHLVGNVVNTNLTAANTSISVSENATIEGNINAVNAIKKIDFTADEKKLTLNSAAVNAGIKAEEVLFTKDGILEIKGNAAQTLNTSFKGGAGLGTIELNSDIDDRVVTFTGVVGDPNGNAIKSLIIGDKVGDKATSYVLLQEGANILTVELGQSNLKLAKAGGIYKIGNINPKKDNTANLIVAEDLTLNAQNLTEGSNFGNAENKLQALVFEADKILTIGDGVNIYAHSLRNLNATTAGAISATPTVLNATNAGNLLFSGNAIFDAKMTATDKINTITGPGAGKEAKIMSEVHANGQIFVGAGTLTFADNVTASKINALQNVTTAAVKFINNDAVTVNAKIAEVAKLATIEFQGNQVTFSTDVKHEDKKFLFTNDNAIRTKAIFNANTDVGKVDVDSQKAKEIPIIVTAKAGKIDFTKTVTGSLEYNLSDTTGAAIAEINSTTLEGASFTTGSASKNKVDFKKAGAKVRSIGELGKNMDTVTFSDNGAVVGDTYSENIIINDGKTGTFGGLVGAGTGVFKLGNGNAGGSIAEFGDGFVLNRKITSNVVGKGMANFAGDATLDGEISGLLAANFRGGADKKVHLNKDIKATDIAFGELTVKLKEADAALEGKTTATGTKFDLASKTLKVKPDSQLSLVGNVAMKTVVSEEGTSGGNIKLDAGATIALDSLTELNVAIDDQTNGFNPRKRDVTFVLVDNSKGSVQGATLSIDKITHINNGGQGFTKWIKTVNDKNTISFTSSDNTKEVGERVLAKSSADDKVNFNIVAFDEKVFEELLKMNDATIKETIERIVATEVEAVVSDIVSLIGSDIGARMGNLAGIQAPTTGSNAIVTSDSASGVAAGDDVSKYGIWSTPFFNKSVQKSRERSAGYDASTGGASFGFDTRANDEMIIGAAFSFLNSDVKHKDHKSGDKTKVESLMFSIYGMQQLTDNWFAQGVVTFGSNSVKTNEKRVNSNTTSQTAEGKYSSMAFSSEALIGYNYSNGMVALTPMAGIRATRVNDGGYKETGTTNQNLTISKKASNKFEVVLGARFSGGTFDLGGLVLTPEVHGFIAQDLVAKNAKIDMRLDGSSKSLETKRAKPNKTSYNAGIGMNAKYNMMEYGLGYDAHLAKNFVGHQGTLKVRVNF